VLFKKKKEERDFIKKIFSFVQKCICFFCVVQLNSFLFKTYLKSSRHERTRRELFCRIFVVLLKVFLSLFRENLSLSLSAFVFFFFFVKDLRNGVAR
tara:strand:- start:1554 stop:1844 length:291 start_codon:yes stop_codon:yes gene_type:complete